VRPAFALSMLSFHEILVRLLFAAAMGAAIGVERDLHHRPAGIRTSMFVCMATALFTILSGELGHAWGDSGSTRIASNIVQGIGFLGAGAILKDSGGMVGMTTAATIFVEAAIGMAAGGGFFRIAGITTGIVIFALVVLAWGAERLNLKPRLLSFRVVTTHTENLSSEIQKLLETLGIPLLHFRVSMTGQNSIVEFEADVSHRQQCAIVDQLNRQGVTTEVLSVVGHSG
jgi:putative Mg2+ transporter-C (MgtC) family protein